MRIINVLIIDDKQAERTLLVELLRSYIHINIQAEATSTSEAYQNVEKCKPDVILLDLALFEKDSLHFLQTIMHTMPTAIILMTRGLTAYPEKVRELKSMGCIYVIDKPIPGQHHSNSYSKELGTLVTNAAYARLRPLPLPEKMADIASFLHPNISSRKHVSKSAQIRTDCTNTIIAIGASTGGIIALEDIIKLLPDNLPPILITQHIPPVFSHQFAQRLNNKYSLNIYDASDGQFLEKGSIYIAPGNWHMRIQCDKGQFRIALKQDALMSGHRPSVDALFTSVSEIAAENIIAVLLTGMGRDGVSGLQKIRDRGGHIIIQDEITSLVWGMPGEAFKLGLYDEVMDLYKIASRLIALSKAAENHNSRRLI